MKNLESKIQQNCVKWFRYQYPKEILFSIPNGGNRNIITASILKAEGLLAGCPDIFLAKGIFPYNGLFIEIKSLKGKLSENQKEMIKKLEEKFYKCVICYSFDDFKNEIETYLHK